PKRLGRRFFEGIADGKDPRESPVDGQEDGGLPAPAQGLTAFLRSFSVDTYRRHQRRIAQDQGPPLPRASHPLPGEGIELCDLDGCNATRDRSFHNRPSQGMLARALKTRGEGKDDRLVNRPERDDLSQRRPAACERSRLIKNESIDVAERLD